VKGENGLVFLGSILVVIILAIILWLLLSPFFSKIGKITGKKANNFKKK